MAAQRFGTWIRSDVSYNHGQRSSHSRRKPDRIQPGICKHVNRMGIYQDSKLVASLIATSSRSFWLARARVDRYLPGAGLLSAGL
jgi:hypothetical protein